MKKSKRPLHVSQEEELTRSISHKGILQGKFRTQGISQGESRKMGFFKVNFEFSTINIRGEGL